jgi:hypothetical protein
LHLLLSLSTSPPSSSSASSSASSASAPPSAVPPPMVLALLEVMGLVQLIRHTWLLDAISGYTTQGVGLSQYKVLRQ